MKIIDTFIAKDGKKISVILPDVSLVNELTIFVNRLCQEDIFLTFSPEQIYTFKDEEKYILNALRDIKNNNLYLLWLLFDGKIVGSADIKRGGGRRNHIGSVGIMIDKDYRKLGLGKYLLEKLLESAKRQKYEIINLTLFSDNVPALSLYKKLGFKEYGKLSKGLYRQKKYSDEILMCKELK